MDLNKIRKIYMIGVKGVGMTMLAQYFVHKGIAVAGSDTAEKYMTDEVLEREKIKILPFSEENLPGDYDLVVYSTAYNKENNVEVAKALAGKVRVVTYAQALGEIFNHKHGIAVVGSHGKTTTTAWLGYVLDGAGLSPTVMVGASVPQFGGNTLVGESNYVVIEADEYQNKLQHYEPKMVLLNNIDYDHPDFFLSVDEYKMAFVEFIKKIPQKGILIANYDDPIIKRIAYANCRGKVVTYGINESADFVAYDIKSGNGRQYFKVKLGIDDSDEEDEESDYFLGDFSIGLAGRHNVSNALAVIAAATELGIDLVKIRTYLADFSGTTRRAQVLGTFRGATIIDDYAHHPTEIKATLSGLRQMYPDADIRVVFHPHTFTRTKALLDDFAVSFAEADEVIVLDIYGSAREQQGGVHSLDLVAKIKENDPEADIKHLSTLNEVRDYLLESADRGDLIVLMGAGDVFRIGEEILKDK